MHTTKDTLLALTARRDLGSVYKITILNVLSLSLITLFSGTPLGGVILCLYGGVSYLWAQLLARTEAEPKRKLMYFGFLSIVGATFFSLQQTGMISVLNGQNALQPSTLPFLVGFAFYVLQGLTLVGAVYRRLAPALDFQRHMLALSFFGSFLAGPLFNHKEIRKLGQIEIELPSLSRIYDNLHYLSGGLLFKYVFANWLSRFVDIHEVASPLGVARSVGAFELQVYFDFAGYSLIAYFLCRSFGLPMYFNFRHPFAARDIPEFWRRWHVGLGTWFKENLFQPLRALTRSQWLGKTLLPLLVFSASAAWHGPTLNFLVWGLFHGLAFITAVWVFGRWKHFMWGRAVAKLHIFVVIFYGRLLFMDSDLERLISKFRQLGKFRLMGEEIWLLVPKSGEALLAFISIHWCDLVLALSIAGLLLYEIFGGAAAQQEPYAYFRPGPWTLLVVVLLLLFMQPLEQTGFVYGR